MPGILLAINGGNTVLQTDTDQASQRHFGAITDGGEHRFAKHGTTQGNEVQASQEFTIDA
jgi:hypothetical protein